MTKKPMFILFRKYTLFASTDWKFSLGLRTKILRKEVLRGIGLCAQYFRLDIAMVRQLSQHVILVHDDDGLGFRIQRWSCILIHWRGLRAETPWDYVLRDQHGLSDRNFVHIRFRLYFPLEDRSLNKRIVPSPVSIAGDVRE